jgi:tetratricopeptide (TPR) repeat protein
MKSPTRYNLVALKSRYFTLIAWLLVSVAGFAQSPATPGQTLLVVPFENQSKAPGLEWIGDSFPELLKERLDSPTLFVLSREDRLRAYDRLGIPIELRPSRATIYRIAEQLDVDYVLIGDYNFDGRTFLLRAQLLDMRRTHLLPEMKESTSLPQLIDAQTALAWDILNNLFPGSVAGRDAYLAQAIPLRLDALEHYTKGVIASAPEDQIQHFREAVRLNPSYWQAVLQLGKTYYRERQYDQAAAWLSRIPDYDARGSEADFYLGLAAYYQGDMTKAQSAFTAVAGRLPLAEVYNNLGVVVERRDGRAAEEYFQKAIGEDPSEADYRFNLGMELYRNGDPAGAVRQLREAVAARPNDVEAKSMLNLITSQAGSGGHGVVPTSLKLPAERIRNNYEESSFRQLALKIDAVAEQRLAKADPQTHARYHSDRGHQFLKQGFMAEAEREFREAVKVNPSSAEGHSGLADVLAATNRDTEARAEAEASLGLRPSAEALVVLAQLDLRDNKAEAAGEEADRALRMDPSNTTAQGLKRAVAAKLAQEAQPLPNQ